MKKKGAIELSIGTIVIIVLSMSMLILGLVLVKNIFSGSSENILQMNDKVKDQIGKLFVDDKKTVIYLSNQKAEIKKDEEWGIAFGIKNLVKGTPEPGSFSYEVSVSDPDVESKCGVSESYINDWIVVGRADNMVISPAETYFGVSRILIPENAPLCIVRFHLDVKLDERIYATDFFDVEITS